MLIKLSVGTFVFDMCGKIGIIQVHNADKQLFFVLKKERIGKTQHDKVYILNKHGEIWWYVKEDRTDVDSYPY